MDDKYYNYLRKTTIRYVITSSLKYNINMVNNMNKKESLVSFAETVSMVSSKKPSEAAKRIMILYEEGKIDLETAEKAILDIHNLQNQDN